MPSHIYSLLGMWEDSIRSTWPRKPRPMNTPPGTPGGDASEHPHLLELPGLRLSANGEGGAREAGGRLASPGSRIPGHRVGDRTAWPPFRRGLRSSAAFGTRRAITVRDSQFPAAQSISYFAAPLARTLGQCGSRPRRDGASRRDRSQARRGQERLLGRQTRIQKEAAAAWPCTPRVSATPRSRDASGGRPRRCQRKTGRDGEQIGADPRALGRTLLDGGMNKEASPKVGDVEQACEPLSDDRRSRRRGARRRLGRGSKALYRALTGARGRRRRQPAGVAEARIYLAQN